MVDTTTQRPSTQNQTPSEVFPLPGWKGTITTHWGVPGLIGGTDLMAPIGTPVTSMVSGKVVWSSTQATAPNSGGNSVEILGADGLSYYYAHLLNPVGLANGTQVLAGQVLGAVDNTGDAAGKPSHLHIGIGYGIDEGVTATGGLGKNYNAVARLQALELDPRANDPTLADPTAVPNPPQIQFIPSVPGFTSGNSDIIKLIIQEALKLGVDPFIALGIASKESTFNPTAQNPSGACGLMQLLPCIPNWQDPVTNIDEGLKRYLDKLAACNGSITCALNAYSGGAGPTYVSDVTGRAKAIQTANPTIASGGFSIPTVGGTYGTPGVGGVTTVTAPPEQCPNIDFGSIGPAKISIPNPVCIVGTALKNMTVSLSNWWQQWQTSHIPNWIFVILGIVLIIIGGLALANSAGMQPPNINVASGSGAAEGAPSSEAVEALAFA